MCRYWSRKFKKHLDQKKSGRMTAIPQLDVPDILVEDEEERKRKTAPSTPYGPSSPLSPTNPGSAPLRKPSTFLSPNEARNHHKTWSGNSGDISSLQIDTSSANVHPLSMPRTGQGASTGMQRQGSHLSGTSNFSFELQEPGSGNNSADNSRRTSAVSPSQMREILDDSIWVESIRRSATTKRRTGW